jgi:hypothetical protein
VLPFVFCVVPLLAGVLVAVAVPAGARDFYLQHMSPLDGLILALGGVLFVAQMLLSWRALRWRETSFDEGADRWLSKLAQAAEWFPLLGLLGTVAGILQTFGGMKGQVPAERVISLYAPAITATGSGLFMALVNILPTWFVLIGRELILALGGGEGKAAGELPP